MTTDPTQGMRRVIPEIPVWAASRVDGRFPNRLYAEDPHEPNGFVRAPANSSAVHRIVNTSVAANAVDPGVQRLVDAEREECQRRLDPPARGRAPWAPVP